MLKYYQKNKERLKKYNKKYRKENSDKIKKHKKEYYWENLEEIKKQNRKYRKDNPEKIRKRNEKWYKKRLEKLAGRKQPKQCEICGAFNKMCFDHNHKTNKFRGWLCYRCNSILGLAEDSPDLLNALIEYIKKSE